MQATCGPPDSGAHEAKVTVPLDLRTEAKYHRMLMLECDRCYIIAAKVLLWEIGLAAVYWRQRGLIVGHSHMCAEVRDW